MTRCMIGVWSRRLIYTGLVEYEWLMVESLGEHGLKVHAVFRDGEAWCGEKRLVGSGSQGTILRRTGFVVMYRSSTLEFPSSF